MSLPGNAAVPARDSRLPAEKIESDYQRRVSQEEHFFGNKEEVHDLPPIFHYWSDRYVRPKLEAIGFQNPKELFRSSLALQCERRAGETLRFVSIGSGNCDAEIELAVKLREASHSRFVIDCLEINETMLERGRAAAAQQGVADHVNALRADFNEWRPACQYDGVLANHALHHVVNLEGLFSGIKESLRPGGCFVIADMIGRNGHQRWPEALSIIQEFWQRLPPSYRFNHQLKRYEETFEDWDCSQRGFEGIRAQDILPLLVENFHFERFVAFGNLIDPFVDRSFGPNFDIHSEWDRRFIDQVHFRNDKEIARGAIKPTQMFGVLSTDGTGPTLYQEPFSPVFCVRSPDSPPIPNGSPAESLGRDNLETCPRSIQQELEIACRRLQELSHESEKLKVTVAEQSAWGLKLDQELTARTAWALDLNKELQARTAWALQLDKELEERTQWAQGLDRQLEEANRSLWRRIWRRLKA